MAEVLDENSKSLTKSIVKREKLAVASQSNNFVRYACYELTVTQMRIWLACLRKIPPSATKLAPLHFTVPELASMCGINSDGGAVFWHLYDALNEMKQITADMRYVNKDGSEGITQIQPFFANVYFDDSFQQHELSLQDEGLKSKEFVSHEQARDVIQNTEKRGQGKNKHLGENINGKKYVTIQLSGTMQHELLNLTKDFTQLSLFYLLPMKSRYSLRLYQDLRSYLYLTHVDGGIRPYTVYMSISELQKKFTDSQTKKIPTTLKAWNSIKVNVLTPALDEINKYTDMVVNEDDWELVERPNPKAGKDGEPDKVSTVEYFQATTPTVFDPEVVEHYPILRTCKRYGNEVKIGRRVVGVLLTISERNEMEKSAHLDSAMLGNDTHATATALANATLLMGESPADVLEGTAQLREVSLTDDIARSSGIEFLHAVYEALYDTEFDGEFADTETDIVLPLFAQMADQNMLTAANMKALGKLQKDELLHSFFTALQNDIVHAVSVRSVKNPEAYSITMIERALQNPKLHIKAAANTGTGTFAQAQNARVSREDSSNDLLRDSVQRPFRSKRQN